jgi:hypothetical protein
MIGDFFTKPVGGSKFRRFRNIIMNITHDEYGPVDVDELMAVHYAKMQKRFDMTCENESTISTKVSKVSANKRVRFADEDSQECVGIGSKRSNATWASIRGAHKNIRRSKVGHTYKPTYAEMVADVARTHAATPTSE